MLCGDLPVSQWDDPSCSDYNLDTELIAAAQRGDGTAIALLRHRYATQPSYAER